MAINLTNLTPNVDPNNPTHRAMLEKIQCNILKSHGRDHADHIFVRFTAGADNVAEWIANFAKTHVTSAYKQHLLSESFKRDGGDGEPVYALFLSASGYGHLRINTDAFRRNDNDSSFREGMKHKDRDLRSIFDGLLNVNNQDPDPATWEDPYQGEVHCLIIVAHDKRAALTTLTGDVEKSLSGIGEVLTVESGHKLIDKNKEPIEHFGYRDGISQPLFLKSELDDAGGAGTKWDPSAPLELVLIPDPLVKGEDNFGSFLVFRKLEQDVKGFDEAVVDLAGKLGVDPDLAGAQVVGRFRDGSPITLQSSPTENDTNAFDFDADRAGSKCPMHAHIRKSNPRGTTPLTSLRSERERRIVRRGIPYGERNVANPQTGSVGLLFMCYQADINFQFEFIQRTWIDNPNFPRNLVLPGTGDDPLIGQNDREQAAQTWPLGWDSDDRKKVNFARFVTLRGGEYFFAPSMEFLRTIAD